MGQTCIHNGRTDGRTRRVRALEAVFTFYRRGLSPALHSLSFFRGGCAYQPSCSEYAQLALAHHGLLRGGALAVWRLLRCNPFSRGGWDPVPILPEGIHSATNATHGTRRPRRVP